MAIISKLWAAVVTIMDDVAVTDGSISTAIDMITDGYDGVDIDIATAFPVGPTDNLEVSIRGSLEGNKYGEIFAFAISKGDATVGAADATEANKLHDADGGFTLDMVGRQVKNLTDNTFTYITAFVDSGELTLNDDIFVDTDEYCIMAQTPVILQGDSPYLDVVVQRSGSTDTIDVTIKHRRWRWQSA